MRRGHRRHPTWLLVVAGLALAACSGGDDPPGTSTTTVSPSASPDDGLRLNHLQVIGTHNSYHLQPEPVLFDGIAGFSPLLAQGFEYSHLPLPEQFSEQGIRQIELDVFADPYGGLYAMRSIPPIVGLPAESDDPAMSEPGFKVFHVQDVDFGTTCATLVTCLGQVEDWSDANPDHLPILVLIEAKQDEIDIGVDLGFAVPAPIGPAELDELDAEIRTVFDPDDLLTPDDVRGDHDTLEAAVTTDGWPTIASSRGKVMFALDNGGSVREDYLEGHPTLEGRVLFVSSEPGEPSAAFIKLNDAVGSFDHIQEVVAAGFVVRTRADSDTNQARENDTTTRDQALASGAQWVSTDYPVPDPDFGTDYSVALPGGVVARCNPVSAPPDCDDADLADPP